MGRELTENGRWLFCVDECTWYLPVGAKNYMELCVTYCPLTQALSVGLLMTVTLFSCEMLLPSSKLHFVMSRKTKIWTSTSIEISNYLNQVCTNGGLMVALATEFFTGATEFFYSGGRFFTVATEFFTVATNFLQWWLNFFTVATEFCAMAPNIWGHQCWIFLRVTLLAPRRFAVTPRFFFFKVVHPLFVHFRTPQDSVRVICKARCFMTLIWYEHGWSLSDNSGTYPLCFYSALLCSL